MLRVSLLGNLGADPEVRYTPKGTQIVSFRVAVNQVRTGPEGERQENTEWFRVRVSNRQTEYVQRLGKGSRVLVIGRLDISHFTSKDGESRVGFDVWADDVQGMGQRTGVEAFGAPLADPDAGESADAPGSTALAGTGVGAGSARAAATTGRNGRAHAPNAAVGGATATAERDDLEDLPF